MRDPKDLTGWIVANDDGNIGGFWWSKGAAEQELQRLISLGYENCRLVKMTPDD